MEQLRSPAPLNTIQRLIDMSCTSPLKKLATLALPWVCVIVAWTLLHYSGIVNPSLVPTPAQVARRFWQLLSSGKLPIDTLTSTKRVLVGVILGTLLAVPTGFALGWNRSMHAFADPLINFFRALPPIALIPLVVVYFGIGEAAKVVILFYAAFFSGVIVMYEGVSQISPIYIRVARTLGATDGEIFRRVIVPLSLPHILTAVRVELGVVWATLVASELIAAQNGLGAMIQNASSFFQLDIIYLGIICIGLTALIMDLVLRKVSRRFLNWQEKMTA